MELMSKCFSDSGLVRILERNSVVLALGYILCVRKRELTAVSLGDYSEPTAIMFYSVSFTLKFDEESSPFDGFLMRFID